MTDLERMARKAGILFSDIEPRYVGSSAKLARFADLIRADERERCAKVCEDNAPSAPSYFEIAERLRECAAAIRGAA